MAKLGKRIWRKVKNTYRTFRSDCKFSVYLGILRTLDELGGRIGLKRASAWAHERKDRWIQEYLKRDLFSVIEQYRNIEDVGTPVKNGPIWVCWWTGEESAPHLVKQCISSIRKHAGCHPVYLITKANYESYLKIPTHILDKLRTGQICIANFSDYLRFSLLSNYGGLWLDATIYCSKQIPEEIFQMPVFTCKSPEKNCGYISRYRWTSFCFGGFQDGLLFRFMRDAFDAYWGKNKTAIDYLLVDYLIEMAMSQIHAVNNLLCSVPENNLRRDDLQAAMNAALPESNFHHLIQEDTTLYKLSWRETYLEQTKDGQPTVYDYFLKMTV